MLPSWALLGRGSEPAIASLDPSRAIGSTTRRVPPGCARGRADLRRGSGSSWGWRRRSCQGRSGAPGDLAGGRTPGPPFRRTTRSQAWRGPGRRRGHEGALRNSDRTLRTPAQSRALGVGGERTTGALDSAVTAKHESIVIVRGVLEAVGNERPRAKSPITSAEGGAAGVRRMDDFERSVRPLPLAGQKAKVGASTSLANASRQSALTEDWR